MYKLLTFEGYDRSGPHIFPIEADRERTLGHIKLARPLPPRVEHFIKTARPILGKTQLLIDALGAGEYWGDNANGDIFYEAALRHDGDDYGFRTFEKHGHVFKHHINKDQARAYGQVLLAEYDPVMHRVLLVVAVDDEKCQDILRDLSNGIYWAVSMGAKVPFDRCSVCGNKARTRAEYCPHLRYQMRKILPDGRRVCAINDYPKFFDISFVLIGAEKAAYVLKKVAHQAGVLHELCSSAEEGERVYGKLAAQLKASATKEAEIDKDVPSNLPAGEKTIQPLDVASKRGLIDLVDAAGTVKRKERSLPSQLLDRLAAFPLDELAATLTALGIPLRPEEFQRIVLVRTGQAALADKLASQGVVFDEHRACAATPEWARTLDRFQPAAISEKVALLLRPYVQERSCYPDPLFRRLEHMEKSADEAAHDPMIYNRKWYGEDERSETPASRLSAFVPVAAALAAGLMLLKRQFPQLVERGPLAVLSRHPWLLPLLIGGGVGAGVGLHALFHPRPLSDEGRFDGMNSQLDSGIKSASMKEPWRLGVIPMAYVYAGIQRHRAERGDPLNSVDRFIASRPDLAALASFAAAPAAVRGVRALFKNAAAPNSEPLDDTVPSEALLLRRIQHLAARHGGRRPDAHVG